MSKVVLITGASSGIGKSIAHYLIEKGYIVYGTSRNPREKVVNGINFVALDVTKTETIQQAVKEIAEKEGKIDFLINNAGMGITGPIEETPDDEIKRIFDTNYFGVIKVIKAVLPIMRKNNGGFIINITSIAGYMGLPFRGIYSATKGALELTTEAFRMELKDFNIKMTNIAPGDFATNIAAGRYHSPIIKNSPYEKKYKSTLDLMDKHVDKGKDPLIMAEKVYAVMQEKNPTIHYKVGEFIQKFSIALKHILPDKVYEKMLMKHYKL
ncbi:SDR family oxidoreductase [Mesonia maritima]|uniref:NAD(P)-dependent dehydrogenase (Short-subunit alcohol dehydrogenase family) n=1 Tax=Mesonia maritima TaxID=1793873 RepID=A0ABU1K524_9FLAO|nr:SDR family oxidoreductase [Mesonia maritima]MDR6300355.1 NAD(P)-dependent dehydrogenase (short-subunit alcohol dehydrogenase family) [Mesonia maritima]